MSTHDGWGCSAVASGLLSCRILHPSPSTQARQSQSGGNHETPPESTLPDPPLPLLLRKRGKSQEKSASARWAFGASKICIIPGDTGNSARTAKCGNSSTGRLPPRTGKCALCNEAFTDYGDIVPDHIHPRGMGGAWRDDHPENIQAVHWWCNGEKGSSRG